MLGFDDYPDIAARLRSILAGETHHPHTPQDRRRLLPISPGRPRRRRRVVVPGHTVSRPTLPASVRRPATGPRAVRRRLDGGPMAPLKLASGCDRRCSFCAIPSFRGSFVSRRPTDVLAEARWLAEQGVRELFLVSENSTSYGKDLGDLRLLETLLPELAAIDGVERVRVSYLQPAETRPGLVEAIATHARASRRTSTCPSSTPAPTVLRRMRRFGDPESFLGLLEQVRALAPQAGVRSNVIVGFPGETEDDLADPVRLPGRGPAGRHRRLRLLRRGRHRGRDVRRQARRRRDPRPRRARHRAWSRSSPPSGPRSGSASASSVLRRVASTTAVAEGRAAHQGPEVDGTTTLDRLPADARRRRPGRRRRRRPRDGVDLVAAPDRSRR